MSKKIYKLGQSCNVKKVIFLILENRRKYNLTKEFSLRIKGSNPEITSYWGAIPLS